MWIRWIGLFGLAAGLAGCDFDRSGAQPAEEVPGLAGPVVVTGELYYYERVDLPGGTEALLEVMGSERSGPVAEQVIPMDGRRLPVAFELTVDRDFLRGPDVPVIRAAFRSEGKILWASQPVPVDPAQQRVDLGRILLEQIQAVPIRSVYRCEDREVRTRIEADFLVLEVDGESYRLEPVISASGARYRDPDEPATSFWSKGQEARVVVRGEGLPGCLAEGADQHGGPRARLRLGEDWRILIADGELFDTPEPVTLRFEDDEQLAGIGPCNPYFATYRLDDDGMEISRPGSTLRSCGEESNARERRYFRLLEAVSSFRVDEKTGELVLETPRGLEIRGVLLER